MMKKKRKILIKNISFSFMPALLSYLSKSENILNNLQSKGYIGKNVDIYSIKDRCLILSIVLTFILLTYNIIKAEIERNYLLEQRNQLLGFNKKIFTSVLSDEMNVKNIDLNLRIFVPRKTILNYINKNYKLEYVIRNLNNLAEAGLTNNLKFEVYPNPQGLVGECFVSKQMIYDTDLKNTNATDYKLTKYQIDKTHDLRFILCYPILNTKGKVVSIISIDSKQEIDVNNDNKYALINSVTTFVLSLYEYIPDIFKPKGGIL